MRQLLVFFFMVALAAATLVENKYESKVADKEFLAKQKDIFHLLYHVHQPNIHSEQVKLGKAYDIEANVDKYTDAAAVKHWLYLYHGQLLPQGRIFSIMQYGVMEEAEALYDMFFYAKDYETFYNTACWAREHVNEQMFVYALSVAVLHRSDCQGIILPAPYEIHPYFFFTDEVIQQAYLTKMQGHSEHISPYTQGGEGNSVIINANYTGWYVDYNDEQKLSYFTEDIGLNSFYYYYHLDYPFWMNGKKSGLINDRRGEIFYYVHQQLLARYYLERLSNGLGEIPNFSWAWPVETGFYPSMRYHNGMEFPSRPNHFHVGQEDHLAHLTQVEDYERRIREAIDQGELVNKDGTTFKLDSYTTIDQLASIIESNDDTPDVQFYRYPQFIARMLLGNSRKPTTWHKLAPSALEQYQTSLRDPMFYQLFKRYIGFFIQFQNVLEPYTKEELSFPGVKIENVEVEKLITYFDHYDSEITNVVYQTKDEAEKKEDNLIIKARQHRLNHKPFTVTANVVAEKASKVVFKLFIGPKYNGKGQVMTMDENRMNFVELDQFVYELKSGKNTVQRNSGDFISCVKDTTPSRELYKAINAGLEGTKEFHLDMSESHNGFPQRLILPKGRKGGMPYYVFVMVAPYVEPPAAVTKYDHVISSGVGSGGRFMDGYPMGYPFNKRIDEFAFRVDNLHFEDVFIYHKTEADLNQAHN